VTAQQCMADVVSGSRDSTESDAADTWHEAEKILSMRRKGKDVFYRVKWLDSQYQPSWIHSDDVSAALKDAFHVKRTLTGKLRKTFKHLR